jgi:hypothetical protein
MLRADYPLLRTWRSLIFRASSQEDFNSVAIADLVPTQMTVGMRQVAFKRQRLRAKSTHEAADFVDKLRKPVVLGPGARPYLVDRHHLALALRQEGIGELFVSVVADMTELAPKEFWASLERQNLTRPFDARGHLRSYDDMPSTLEELHDDLFRSLSWSVKKAGGYAKTDTPYAEFRWADFFRSRIPHELVEYDFAHAHALAMRFVGGSDAAALPGRRAAATTRFPSRYLEQRSE